MRDSRVTAAGRVARARPTLSVELIAAFDRRAAPGRAASAADQHRNVLHAGLLLLSALPRFATLMTAIERSSWASWGSRASRDLHVDDDGRSRRERAFERVARARRR
ncbi:hypothetical protein, partial [Burkholderia thailandensis]|uniref:hypothetical protein n=1 Tax=Burkholderia thailandensis TaxID=57975 RepID=UPI00217D4C5F